MQWPTAMRNSSRFLRSSAKSLQRVWSRFCSSFCDRRWRFRGQLPSGVLDQLSSDQSIVLAQMFNGSSEGRMMMTNKWCKRCVPALVLLCIRPISGVGTAILSSSYRFFFHIHVAIYRLSLSPTLFDLTISIVTMWITVMCAILIYMIVSSISPGWLNN